MKKLFTLLVGAAMATMSASADVQTVGLTQDMSNSDAKWTFKETEAIKIVEATSGNPTKGSSTSIYENKTAKTFNSNSTKYYWRTGDPGTDTSVQYLSYEVTIPSGYVMNISGLKATLASESAEFKWTASVLDTNGQSVVTSGEQTTTAKGSKTYSKTDLEVAGLSGKVTVKISFSSGKTKYFVVPDLTIDVALEADARKTYSVTTSKNIEKGGTVSASADFPEGEDAIVVATPAWGYKFVKWTVDDVDVEGNPYTISNINANHTAVATFEKYPWISFAKVEDVEGTGPATEYAEAGSEFILPGSYFLVKKGYSLAGWTDGENTYKIGDKYAVSGDVEFVAVFAENTVALGDAETVVNWVFAPENGAPELNLEGKTGYYVQPATINGVTIDVPMVIDTRDNVGVDGKRGKLNNVGQTNRAQMNVGTVLEIPAIQGMTVIVTGTNTVETGSIHFNGEEGVVDSKAKTITYTYNGIDEALKMIDQKGSMYPSGVKVIYPVKPEPATVCEVPTATVSEFSFENHGYTITFTAAQGQSLMVSKDGGEYAAMDSPAVIADAAKASAYAVAEGLDNSEAVEAAVPANDYDSSKPYIAWVYVPTYNSVKDNHDGYVEHALIKALKEVGNVVMVKGDDNVAPSEDLAYADLVVCSEAVAGAKTLSNGMKAFAENEDVKMINLKFYNYSSGRWSWGSPDNNQGKAGIIYPTKSNYMLFDGVTTLENGGIKMFTDDMLDKNHVQTVTLSVEGHTVLATTNAPAAADPETIASRASYESNVAVHTAKNFLGLGLSSDDWAHYGDNAAKVVKNGANMLLNDVALDKTVGDTPTGIATIVAEENEAVEYYNLQGQRVANPAQGGLYIRKAGSKAEKVIL